MPKPLADRVAHWLIGAFLLWCAAVVCWGVPVCVMGLYENLTN